MVTFLTSSFIKYQPDSYIPLPLDESNHFVDNLKRYWIPNTHFLIFASNPSDAAASEHAKREMKDAFSLSGLPIEEIHYFDYQYIEEYGKQHDCVSTIAAKEALKDALQWADVFYLSGGHVPTGSTPLEQAKVECKEELGFDLEDDKLTYLGPVYEKRVIIEVYLYEDEDRDLEEVEFDLQEEEVAEVVWLTKDEMEDMMLKGMLRDSTAHQYMEFIKNM